MFDRRVTLLLCLAVFTVVAQYTTQELINFVDGDSNGVISEQEFNNWINAWFDYEKTPTIMNMTGEIPVDTFIEVYDSYNSSRYTGQQTANFADKNNNGNISPSEFDRWFEFFPNGTDKAEMVFAFTGNIPVDTFQTHLTEKEPIANQTGGYTVEQAVSYANENNDDEIDAYEFNKWYDAVKYFTAQYLEPIMKGNDSIITVDEFLAVVANI